MEDKSKNIFIIDLNVEISGNLQTYSIKIINNLFKGVY